MSSGKPSRPRGVRSIIETRKCSGIDRTSGVAISPGMIALAVTPRGPNSCATAFVKPMTPAFDAVYAGWPRPGCSAPIDAMLITRPQPRAAIAGTTLRTVWNMPFKLTLVRPRLGRHLLDRSDVVHDTRVINQDVDRADLLVSDCDHVSHRHRIGNVYAQGKRSTSERRDRSSRLHLLLRTRDPVA
jgi:hypothetical protein